MNPLDKSATQSPTQYPHPPFIFVFESQTNGGNGKKTDGGCVALILFAPASTNQSLPCLLSQSVVSVFIKPRASRMTSVPCRSSQNVVSVFFFKPRASKMTSVSCRLRQSVVSIFFNPWASKIASVSCRLLPSCLLYASHRKNVDPSRKHEPVFTISVESKWCVFFFFTPRASKIPSVSCRSSQNAVSFFLSLEQARSRLCHVGLVKMLSFF